MLDLGDAEFVAWHASANEEDAPVEPVLEPHQRFYWRIWQDIKDDRHFDGMGAIGPISYLVLSRYAEDHCISETEFMNLKIIIKAMDSTFLEYIRKNRPKAPEQ
jgi:hypothetical protein